MYLATHFPSSACFSSLMPPPPPSSPLFPYTTLFRSPIITVVATPEPDGPPSRNEESTTARPALLGLPPMALREKSMKNLPRSEEHTSEVQSLRHLVCRLLLEKKKNDHSYIHEDDEHL